MSLFWNKYPYTDFHELNADWIIKHFKEFLEEIESLDHWKEEHEKEYEELKKLYDDLMSGNYPDSFSNSLKAWISKYGVDIIAEQIKTVHFGLTNDGYFCAFIPSSWSEVQFDTVNDSDDPLYGHLMLIYE